jgi:hypothetical protein
MQFMLEGSAVYPSGQFYKQSEVPSLESAYSK